MSPATIGEVAPGFDLACVSGLDTTPRPVRLHDYRGRWLMLIFYPRDFSFVCPTELTAFSARLADFADRDCDVLGISVDSLELHQEWLTTPTDKGGLGPLRFPLASDTDGATARDYGVWVEDKEVSTRGLFVIDPDGVLQYSVLHNLSVGRNPDEVLRVLDALQTGGLCPASWTSADGTIDLERLLQPGRILGHYRIRKQLGDGTFGTVFAAHDMRLDRMVALKVLKRNVFESREAVLTEARAVAKLNHPHVCTLYAVEEEDGLPLIAMEYLEGHSLAEVIKDGLGGDKALALAEQISAGLAAAHSQNVVHGDLKPANVIITSEMGAKILDFGLAGSQSLSRATEAATAANRHPPAAQDTSEKIDELAATIELASLTPTSHGKESGEVGMIRGTPAYMSPEQAAGSSANPASDVFSFGLMLFEMLTGRQALSAKSLVDMVLKLQTADLAPELTPHLDQPYRELLSQMLARDANQRPPIDAVLKTLDEIRSSESTVP